LFFIEKAPSLIIQAYLMGYCQPLFIKNARVNNAADWLASCEAVFRIDLGAVDVGSWTE
jgi:hypothetical protein